MMLPASDQAYVDRVKITEYLLSLSHPDGQAKAVFFMRFGFSIEEWKLLADALLAVGRDNPVIAMVKSKHGVRYTVDGSLNAPDGRNPEVRTVWIVEQNTVAPRLITAFPIRTSL